ncbi:MAG: potassium channel protein [Acidobacteriota bacterium]
MTLRKRIVYSVSVVTAVMIVGTVGYHWLEGWAWFDGLYMTVITLATIGYGETHPLTHGGRVFTLLLIGVGVVIFGFLISNLTQVLFATELEVILGRRKLFKDISKLKDHYIICGAGRVGSRVIEELRKKQADFIVIERDHQVAQQILMRGDLVLVGDATDETVLQGAHLREARALISAASTDAENVYIVLTARGMNPNIYIVSRAFDEPAERQLMRAGANKVVSPVLIGSHKMAQAALSPGVADFIELTTMTESLDLNFEQVRILPGSPLEGLRLEDSGVSAEQGAMLVAITDHDGNMHFNPDGGQLLQSGDLLIAIGTQVGLTKLAELARYKPGGTRKLPKREVT